MQESSLVKWVDELQAQIDEVKRTGGQDAAIIARVAALEDRAQVYTGTASDLTTGPTITKGVESAEFTIAAPADPALYDLEVYAQWKRASSEYAWISAMTKEFAPVVKYDMTLTAADPVITGAVQVSSTASGENLTISLERALDGGSIGMPEGDETGITINYVIIAKKKPPVTSRSRKKK